MTTFAIQPTFGRGELSPRLHARIDIDHWRLGLAECFNFIVLRQGGLRRRPGTRFVAKTRGQGPDDKLRLIPFEFSVAQSYVLELGHLYMRVNGLGGQVAVGGVPYEIPTPWAGKDLARLHFKQSGDVIYVVHRGYPPTKITRRGETNWTIEVVDFQDGPYLEINDTGTSIRPLSTGDLIPQMTGPSAPSGVAVAESEYAVGADYPAWQAFNADRTDEWMSALPGATWLQYQFASPKVVTGYVIRASQEVVEFQESSGSGSNITYTTYKIPGSLRAPRTWTFQGSNDGATWTVLHTQSGETGWGDGERRYYTFANVTPYSYFRLSISNTSQPDRPTSVAELSFLGGGGDVQSVVLTASSQDGINRGAGFVASDVGRHVRLLSEDAYWHWFKITAVNSPTSVTAHIRAGPIPTTNRIPSWRLGAFSSTTGYPQALAFYLERLCYAGTKEKPQSVYGSRTGAFDDFGTSTPLVADDAFSFTFGTLGEIVWLEESGDLVVGTASAIRTLGPADKNEGFSATNVTQGKPARAGSAPLQPVMAGHSPLFVGRFGDAVREAAYSFDAQGYLAPDVSVLSEHMLRPGVTAISYAQDPNAMVWCALADGTLAAITFEKDQQMTAMHRHALGGGGFVESLCVVSGLERHEVWMLVRRLKPNGITLRTIECLAADSEGADPTTAFYVDCGLSYAGAATSAAGGFDHLETFPVAVLADGATQPPVTVSGGVVTVPDGLPASSIHAGLPYESRATTLPIAQGLGDGSGLGRKKRVSKVIVNMFETGQVRAKATSRSYQDLILRSAGEAMGASPPLVTDDIATHIDDQWGGRGRVSILCDAPLPATIRAVTLAFEGEP